MRQQNPEAKAHVVKSEKENGVPRSSLADQTVQCEPLAEEDWEEGTELRVAGIPVSRFWSGHPDAILDTFEPENPHLFVPRVYGLGWDLNLGAVAMKAGWIRPDDSLPDLAAAVPEGLRKFLQIGPLVGGAVLVTVAGLVARKDRVAIKWTLSGKPRRFAAGWKAAFPALLAPAVVAVLPSKRQVQKAGSAVESVAAISLAQRADLLGMEAMSLAILLASYRSARPACAATPRRQPLVALAPLLWPVVTGGLQLACVKTALRAIAHTEAILAGEIPDDGIPFDREQGVSALLED